MLTTPLIQAFLFIEERDNAFLVTEGTTGFLHRKTRRTPGLLRGEVCYSQVEYLLAPSMFRNCFGFSLAAKQFVKEETANDTHPAR